MFSSLFSSIFVVPLFSFVRSHRPRALNILLLKEMLRKQHFWRKENNILEEALS
jgi:hypothetical protein